MEDIIQGTPLAEQNEHADNSNIEKITYEAPEITPPLTPIKGIKRQLQTQIKVVKKKNVSKKTDNIYI